MAAFRWKCLTAIALVLAFSTAAADSETITVHGTDGTFPGGDATANAGPGPGPDATNTANAFGGTGAVFNGLGYIGGNATATATTSITSGAASAYSDATGGDGGGFNVSSFVGLAGNGGSATAISTASTSGNNT